MVPIIINTENFLILNIFVENVTFSVLFVEYKVKGDLTHTVSPNLMLILSTYRVVLHSSYLVLSYL